MEDRDGDHGLTSSDDISGDLKSTITHADHAKSA